MLQQVYIYASTLLCPACHHALESALTEVPATTVFGEPRRTVMPVSEPARRKRLWASQETADVSREVAIRQRLEVQQAVAAAIAAPTPAPPAVAAPDAPVDATAAAEADAAADAEANAMLPDEDGEDAGLLAFANADAADAAVNAAAEAAELAAADTEVESDAEARRMPTAFTLYNYHAVGHWTEESESATLGSSDDGPASDNESLGTLPAGLTEPEPPTDSASEAAPDSAAESTAAPTTTAPRRRFLLVIRRNAPRQVMIVPAPLVRTISVLPLTPVLPTGQYDSTPIVIDDDGEEADDEDEADDAASAQSPHDSTEALHGSDT
ncbi:MAG: mucin-associated surface protein, partial [Rhodospirillaceae bacterium]